MCSFLQKYENHYNISDKERDWIQYTGALRGGGVVDRCEDKGSGWVRKICERGGGRE